MCVATHTENHRRSRPAQGRVRGLAIGLLAALTLSVVPHIHASAALQPHTLPSGRPQGYLGIEFHDLTDEQYNAVRPAQPARGAEVVMVDHDGPAGKAGLKPHDIIVSLNGQLVAGAEALRRMIHEAGAGMSIALAVVRGGHTVTVNAQLADRTAVERQAWARVAGENTLTPSDDPPAGSFGETLEVPPVANAAPAPMRQSFIGSMLHGSPGPGLVVHEITPQLAAYFGAPGGMGLLVDSVLPNTPAAAAGLRAGDILLRADTVPLHSASDWNKRLRAAKGKPLPLTVLRDKHEQTLVLQPEARHHSLLEWPSF